MIRDRALILVTSRLSLNDMIGILEEFCSRDISLRYTIEPGYAVASYIGSEDVVGGRYVVIPPHSIILGGDQVFNNICRKSICLRLLQPTWIKTHDTSTCEMLDLLNNIINASMYKGEGVVVEKLGGLKCSDVMVLDGIFRYNPSWLTGRRPFTDEKYREVLRRRIEGGGEIPLLVVDDTPISYYRDGKLIMVTSRECGKTLARIYLELILDHKALMKT